MKQKTGAVKKTAAFRVRPCIIATICFRFGLLALTLALFALPSAGTTTEVASFLTSLSAEIVPLRISMQAPFKNQFYFPRFSVPATPVLSLARSTAIAMKVHTKVRLQNVTSYFRDLHMNDGLNGRSPPAN
jgi:hypothetical protein